MTRMGWTGRAPAPNRSEDDRGLRSTRSTSPLSHKTAATVAHTIGIDTGKNTLHLIGLDDQEAIVLREKIARGRIAARLANVPWCLIGIEAGMATHYVARELGALGHDVKQVPPAYSKPFRQGHKNDFRDAHAVAEAVQRPSTRCVPVKTDDQLDLQALHLVRSRLVGQRTAVINQIPRLSLGAWHCGTSGASLSRSLVNFMIRPPAFGWWPEPNPTTRITPRFIAGVGGYAAAPLPSPRRPAAVTGRSPGGTRRTGLFLGEHGVRFDPYAGLGGHRRPRTNANTRLS